MPEAVEEWLQNRNLVEVERIQDDILASYELDFAKYATASDFPKLKLIWKNIPAQLSRESGKFLYGHAKPGARAKDLEVALRWLSEAGLVHRVGRVERPAVPLSAYLDHKAFKLFLADIGLLRRLAGVPGSVMLDGNPLYSEFKGALTENFVLNELLRILGDVPCYWTSGNLAEVDFIFQFHDKILALEVKASTNVRSRSLAAYREKYQPQLVLRTSLLPYTEEAGLLNIPLYLLWNMQAYVDAHLSRT
jgi:predicted AAA+ superfamily ATPase